jgi:pimeloyl-ACP methyl ester carboxylesterase
MSAARLQQIVTLFIVATVLVALGAGAASGRWAWGLGVALLALGAHAAVMACEFVLVAGLQRRDSVPPATWRQIVRAWWAEVWSAPRVFCWDQPFHSQRHPDHLPTEARGRRAVLLVHGFVCNRGFWNPWMPRLRAAGVPHVAITMEPVFGDIEGYAPQIETAVQRLEAATGLPPVIVAHSMGGLAVRAWLAAGPGRDARVHRVITMGSPHRGTWLARFGLTPNARQMRQDPCAWRDALEGCEPEARFTRFTCFYSHCDNVVFPASTSTLPGADNRHLPGSAHVHLMHQPEVFSEVLAWAAGTVPGPAVAVPATAPAESPATSRVRPAR